MPTDTIDLTPTAVPGDRVQTTRGAYTVSATVWPDNWPEPVTLEPIALDVLDAFAPADYLLPSRLQAPRSVFPSGRAYHGACRATTNGAAVVRKNSGDWLRCRIELWNGEGERKLIRGLVRIDR